jgi:hypothetical protein
MSAGLSCIKIKSCAVRALNRTLPRPGPTAPRTTWIAYMTHKLLSLSLELGVKLFQIESWALMFFHLNEWMVFKIVILFTVCVSVSLKDSCVWPDRRSQACH